MKSDQPIEPAQVKTTATKTLAERIAALTPAQRSLFEIKTRQRSPQKDKPRIPKRQDPPPWPASIDQTALWFIQQLEPSTSAYNIGNGYRLRGKLDVALLERCLNIVTQRHEILRTGFLSLDGQPYQVVSDQQFKIPVTDLRNEPDPESAAQARAAALIKEPFDLENGPMLRLPLLQVADDDFMLIGVLHHIVTDWWSYHLFFTELFGLYTAFIHNRPDPLPELPIQFADWAAWRDQWEKSDALTAQESYWLGKLEGVPYAIEIPADRPRPRIQSHRGAREFFVLSSDVAEKVRSMDRQAGVSSFMTFLAAINAFLFRYTGQQEFLIGTPVSADRDTDDTANLIGYLLNTIVLRADLTGNPNFMLVLERVRGACMEAFAHKDFPFRKLVERLKPDRDMSRMPLYQVEYIYTSAENPIQQSPAPSDVKFKLPECEVRSLSIDRKTSPVDLQLAFTGARDQFNFMIEYNSDIFDGPTVRQMGHQLLGLLESLLNHPLRPVATIPLLGQEDRIIKTSHSSFHAAEELTITELFHKQVARTPAATAVICGERRLKYSELNERANQLAHYLRARGIGPEVPVGVWLPRSLDLVVALFGILKAGGAYVPLDMNYPKERVSYMLDDSRAPVLLTLQGLHSDLQAYTGRRILLDAEKEHIARESIDAPSVPLHPENIAYLVYTSGSTGKPKAVATRHSSAATFLHWMREVFTDEELSGVLASTSICFDPSVLEIFGPASWGGTSILVNNALDLAALNGAQAVTLIDTVPTVMTELVHMGALPNTVMTVILGGEALPMALVRQVYQMKCVQRVYNLYGPTEDTIFSSFELVSRGEQAAIAPVGVPVTSTELHVLDDRMQPVSSGQSGELYIGGDGLARGYLNRPELTAERFVPDPFTKRPGARLYYTGDRMRYRADGGLEYLGRADHQVKVRGFRIELGEIEAALNECPGIARAVVLAREDVPGQKRLVAYLVARNTKTVRIDELRSHLQKKLPDYMVPSLFVMLERLPLMPNGKVNRSALPEPEDRGDMYRAPRSPRDVMLCEIFAEVLGRTQVGIDDNFFDLGGHSLIATRLVSRVRKVLDLDLSVRAVFDAPTVAQLSDYLTAGEHPLPHAAAYANPSAVRREVRN